MRHVPFTAALLAWLGAMGALGFARYTPEPEANEKADRSKFSDERAACMPVRSCSKFRWVTAPELAEPQDMTVLKRHFPSGIGWDDTRCVVPGWARSRDNRSVEPVVGRVLGALSPCHFRYKRRLAVERIGIKLQAHEVGTQASKLNLNLNGVFSRRTLDAERAES
jgi:hypothetical protein